MAQDTKKKAVAAADTTTFVLIVVAIVVIINVILALPSTPPLRADLTEDRIYTLSDASQELVGTFEEPMLVKFFVTENLQYPDHNLEQRVRDLLDEYQVHSGGKLTFEVVYPEDPKEFPSEQSAEGAEESEDAAEEEAKGFGCQKVTMGQRDSNQVSLRLVYKCIAFVYGDKNEVLGEVKSNDNLEYEFTKRMKLLVTPESAYHKVGFVTGFGGPADQPQFIQAISDGFKQIYGDLISARPVDLKAKQKVDDDVSALVILNPNAMFTDGAKYAIDQFLMQGKGVAWLQTGLAPNPQMPQLPMRQPVITGLEPVFETYGLRMNKDMILDRKQNIVGIAFTNQGIEQISNPSMPVFTDINKEAVFTKDIPMLAFPLANSITILPSALENEDLQVLELVRTSKHAVRRPNATSIAYDSVIKPDETEESDSPFVVAASLQGPLKSHFADKAKPTSEATSNPADALPPDHETLKASTAGSRVIVVSNGDFMFPNRQTGFGGQYSNMGVMFLLGMMDWLVQEEALVKIRSKGVPRVIKNIEPEDYNTYQAANIVGVPVIFILVGLVFWFIRRQRQSTLKL